MQTQQTITFFGAVSNSATSRISKNGRKYTAFGAEARIGSLIPARSKACMYSLRSLIGTTVHMAHSKKR